MRVEEWVRFVLTLARLWRLPLSIILGWWSVAYRIGQWDVLKSSWTSLPTVLWRVVWYSKKKKKCQVLRMGWNNPSHQCRPGVARRQLSKYFMGRNPEVTRLFSVVPSDRAGASRHKTKLLTFLVSSKGDLYCGTGYPGCVKSPSLEIFETHP